MQQQQQSMLPTNLTTNEVKDASGVEVEFLGLETVGRTRTFAKSGEVPSQPYRLKVQHREVGSGVGTRRQSNIRITKVVDSDVATDETAEIKASLSLDVPIGHLDSLIDVKNVLANMLSFCATTGAATIVLFDCTGYGADTLVNGSL